VARLLLGVSGGIAAYKAVEVVRLATAAGHAVRVIQTPSSLKFVGRATFEGVTGAPVLVDEFECDPARGAFPGEAAPDHDPISHLELVRRCDALAVAPASANTIAKLAAGLADNLLTSAALASPAPLVVAPAMNDRMLEHPATRENLERLRARGARIVAPGRGRLASKGEWGVGRLAEPSAILAEVEKAITAAGQPFGFIPRSLDGLRVLVTAGGTREPIDPVRYVGNRSSGRMGLALAAEAARRGAEVTLIAANVALPRPEGIRSIDVESAAELEATARAEFERADVLLMAAAVADFRPPAAERAKIAKAGRERLSLELEPTADVLLELARDRRPGQTLVGFAAEHGEGGLERARAKLERKGLDAVVLNDVSRPDIAFDAEQNEVAIVTAGAVRPVARGPKGTIAAAVLDEVEALRGAAADSRAARAARVAPAPATAENEEGGRS
jgi:phosphopantothenoylcysteine decarboxylase/phosphopantothenate--cysteine ligase